MNNHKSNEEFNEELKANLDNDECHYYNPVEICSVFREFEVMKQMTPEKFLEKLDIPRSRLSFEVPPQVAILVVEGKEDVYIYKLLLKTVTFDHEIEIVEVGGRAGVLKVYDEVTGRREDFPRVPIIFIADQDMDIFKSCSLSSNYSDVIWTRGYSIENDLYNCSREALKGLLDPHEKCKYEQLLMTMIEWFAFQVEKFEKTGDTGGVKESVRRITASSSDNRYLTDTKTNMCPNFKNKIGFESPTPGTLACMKADYPLKLRGKNIFEMLSRLLSYKERKVPHSPFQLYTIAWSYALAKDQLLQKQLEKEINDKIYKEKVRIARPS